VIFVPVCCGSGQRQVVRLLLLSFSTTSRSRALQLHLRDALKSVDGLVSVTTLIVSMAHALLRFCAITVAHTAWILAYRVTKVINGAPVNSFQKSRFENESSLYGRICASHANCLENLP
jgi:hypothetical protein